MNAYLVYLVIEAVRGLGIGLLVVAAIYRIEMAGFGPLELVLAGTALEVAYFVSEIPTGVVADVYSRRLSVIVGALVMGVAWVLEGSFPVLWVILTTQAVLGVGWTFFSGATEAWLIGEVGEDRGPRAIVHGRQAFLAAMFVGGFVAAALGSIRLNIPIVVAGASHLALSAFLVVAMPETGFVGARHATRRAAISATARGGWGSMRGDPVLMAVLGASLLTGMFSEGVDRLWQAHLWENLSLPRFAGLSELYWFPVVAGVAILVSLPALRFSRRWVERPGDKGLAAIGVFATAVAAGATAAFGLAPTLITAMVAFWCIQVARHVLSPVYTVWVVRRSPPELRATMLSIEGQSHSIGEIASGPALGVVGRLVSIPAALLASATIQALAIPLLLRAGARGDDGTFVVEAPGVPPDRPGLDPAVPEP